MKLLKQYQKEYAKHEVKEMSLEEYLKKAAKDPSMYNSAAERMLKAIGEPEIVDTSKDARLSRLFGNKCISRYECFSEFYGLEDVIHKIVSFFKHAAQQLEESRQILYLLGPVGSAKSSLAEKLKSLMEQEPIYVLADEDGNLSPVNESPLGLFKAEDANKLDIPERYFHTKLSPWALKRMKEYKGDLSKFKVFKVFPSQDDQVGICKTEPGDENNQDISALVGKLDIRQLEFFSQNDPDAYNYSGGLCLANQGMLEFVEMFKAPIKVLHPLLTATQEHNYKGTESLSAIPFDGVVLAHSNESEWESFKNDKSNEAFLDRVYIVEVPYCLRVDEEVKIYKKLLKNSALCDACCAPGTLEMLARFAILTRIEEPDNSRIDVKMQVYNGENVRTKNNDAKSLQEYKESATSDEGFSGVSTRLAYKILARVYNFDNLEVAADPVHMLCVLNEVIKSERLDEATEQKYVAIVTAYLTDEYISEVGKHIQTAYLDSYNDYGQALFDNYILYADHWVQDRDYRDPDTNTLFDRNSLNKELTKIEKPAGISNPKDFRHEVVNFALRYQAKHEGKNPSWTSYEKLRNVIEDNMFSKTEDLLPVISFGGKGNKDDQDKHNAFVERMVDLGYTKRQVKRVVEWHRQMSKS